MTDLSIAVEIASPSRATRILLEQLRQAVYRVKLEPMPEGLILVGFDAAADFGRAALQLRLVNAPAEPREVLELLTYAGEKLAELADAHELEILRFLVEVDE